MLTITPECGNSKYNFDCNGVACMSQKRYSNHYTMCMFYCIGIYNKHCLSLQKLKPNNTQHTHPLKFSNLVIVHTLDFWYMIKNK